MAFASRNLAPVLAALAFTFATDRAFALETQPPKFTRAQMEAAIPTSPPFRFVYGTRDPAATPTLRARAIALARFAFDLDSTRVIADRAADEKMLASGPIYLLGGSRENEWTARLAAALPVQFEAGGFRFQGHVYDQRLDAIHLSYPNPLSTRWFLLLAAGNSPEALARREGWTFGDEDWRILRAGTVVRTGAFAQADGTPWRYDPARDRDREAERERFQRVLRAGTANGLTVNVPGNLAQGEAIRAAAFALLARMDRDGWAAPAGARPATLTIYHSLAEKGAFTRETRPEHVEAAAAGPAAHAALPFGRDALDLWCVAAARLSQCGASTSSRFGVPAAVDVAGRFEGETFARSLARLYFAGLLPEPAEAATRFAGWRSPLVWVPARALLVRAIGDVAAPAKRREARLALLRRDPPGTLDSLCRVAGVAAAAVEQRYRALADSLARAGREAALRTPRRPPWRPAQGFQRGVCLAHQAGLEQGYLSRECATQIAKIREAGADGIALTPFLWLADRRKPELDNSSADGPDGESDEALVEAAARAHASGLRVWLKPHVWTRDGWAGDVTFSPAQWQRFFADYETSLLHWSIVAEREGFDGLDVGHELPSATAADPARWRAMIAKVRRVFGGTLSYAASWDEAAKVSFWDALDVIGVTFHAPLASAPTRDPHALRRGADKALAGLNELARRYGRSVLLAELGYTPNPNAPVRPWEESAAATDEETQLACYEATIAALDPCLWVAGAYFSRWGSSARPAGVFDPRGRPAGAAMLRALQAWQGRPVRVPVAGARR